MTDGVVKYVYEMNWDVFVAMKLVITWVVGDVSIVKWNVAAFPSNYLPPTYKLLKYADFF